MLLGAWPAAADSYDNDGLNIGNDNNTSVLPIQACGNNISVLGLTKTHGQDSKCVNAPIVDHPHAHTSSPEKPKPPAEHPKPPSHHHQPPGHHHQPPGHHHQPPSHHHQPPGHIPEAPTPVPTDGHVVVTG
ncbi:hypothetical protein [Saccharopolyspora rhizosphaerae]|uniref:hypothetical protein n=1 Tax=Saccharopolyspora rhizosphaerae TaxID=2492662 RepID=UPI0026B02879|nr:hypothetical protein [Saccharopolyspora rhizosphaerae]